MFPEAPWKQLEGAMYWKKEKKGLCPEQGLNPSLWGERQVSYPLDQPYTDNIDSFNTKESTQLNQTQFRRDRETQDLGVQKDLGAGLGYGA